MSNLVTATVTMEGIRPLLWNAFTLDAIPLTKREKTGVAGNDPEEWKRTVLATDEGVLFVTREYIFSCLQEAATYTKKGKSTLQKPLAATLQVTDERILIANRRLPHGLTELAADPTQPVYLDIRSVRNPQTKARNVRYRVAAAPGWELTCHLLWDVTIVSQAELAAILRDSGQLVGLGNGRRIGFGRFVIKALEVQRMT